MVRSIFPARLHWQNFIHGFAALRQEHQINCYRQGEKKKTAVLVDEQIARVKKFSIPGRVARLF